MTYKTHIAGGLLLAGALQHIPAFHHPETTHIGLLAVINHTPKGVGLES